MGREEKLAIAPARRQTEVARWISAIVHPIVFPLLTLGIVTYTAGHSFGASLRWVLLALLLTSVPITALVGFQVLRGRWSDLDVSVRRQRYILYPFGLVCVLALAAVYVVLKAPRIALVATAGLALANVANGLINLSYKVSAHAAAAAMCATLFWAAAPAFGVPATVAALLVGWSRVELGRHTAGQVVLGWGVGVASILALLALLPAQL